MEGEHLKLSTHLSIIFFKSKIIASDSAAVLNKGKWLLV